MLTVNHSDVNHTETIYEVMKVEYDPNEGSCDSSDEGSYPCIGLVSLYLTITNSDDDKLHYHGVKIYKGNVYIMNSEAKTIATYRLGGWLKEVPTENQNQIVDSSCTLNRG